MKTFLIALLAALPALSAGYSLELTPGGTKIGWTLTDPLHTVHGTFKLKRGTVTFDPETGKAGGTITVDVASGESGSEARDSRMHANVLESRKYPEATFTPDRVDGKLTLPGKSSVKLHGMFRIHGADHEVTMDVQTTVTGDQMEAELRFDIPYVAWGMKDPSNFLLKVGKSVQMDIRATGTVRTEFTK